MATTAPPKGCGTIDSDYYFLCNLEDYWGIILEALAAAGVVATATLLFVFLSLTCRVQDQTKRSLIPVQVLFLLGTLGIFGLTFAFIIRLNETTAPTRFFLFGVLFALCFACLLAHALDLIKLVRGRRPFSVLILLVMVLSLTAVQVIIAIQYVAVNIKSLKKLQEKHEMTEEMQKEFILILIYVLFLMALLCILSMFVFCGSYKGWKRHGIPILLTALVSVAIWVVWITILMKGIPNLGEPSAWKDPVIGIALIANGWTFLILYAVPELCVLTAPRKPGDYPLENHFCQPKGMKKAHGIENRGYAQEDKANVPEEYVPYSTHFQLENLEPQQEFSIPRPKTRPSPYQGYSGGKGVK